MLLDQSIQHLRNAGKIGRKRDKAAFPKCGSYIGHRPHVGTIQGNLLESTMD